MNKSLINGQLAWLSATLASQRNNISALLLRLRGFGMSAGSSLILHRKFMRLMEQVADDRKKEMDIIGEIEAMENRHRHLKEHRMLRSASPEPAQKAELAALQSEDEKPKRAGILGLIAFLYLMSAKRVNHKNQRLTVD